MLLDEKNILDYKRDNSVCSRHFLLHEIHSPMGTLGTVHAITLKAQKHVTRFSVLRLGNSFPFIYVTVSIVCLEKSAIEARCPDLESGRRKRHPSQTERTLWPAVRELFFPEWIPASVPSVHAVCLVSNDTHL